MDISGSPELRPYAESFDSLINLFYSCFGRHIQLGDRLLRIIADQYSDSVDRRLNDKTSRLNGAPRRLAALVKRGREGRWRISAFAKDIFLYIFLIAVDILY